MECRASCFPASQLRPLQFRPSASRPARSIFELKMRRGWKMALSAALRCCRRVLAWVPVLVIVLVVLWSYYAYVFELCLGKWSRARKVGNYALALPSALPFTVVFLVLFALTLRFFFTTLESPPPPAAGFPQYFLRPPTRVPPCVHRFSPRVSYIISWPCSQEIPCSSH